MDNTATIFNLIISDNHETGQSLGLSISISKFLAGSANQNADTQSEFIEEVLNQAKKFHEHVQSVIDHEVLPNIDESNLDENEFRDIKDLEILNSMKKWTFDKNHMEQKARDDWNAWSSRQPNKNFLN